MKCWILSHGACARLRRRSSFREKWPSRLFPRVCFVRGQGRIGQSDCALRRPLWACKGEEVSGFLTTSFYLDIQLSPISFKRRCSYIFRLMIHKSSLKIHHKTFLNQLFADDSQSSLKRPCSTRFSPMIHSLLL